MALKHIVYVPGNLDLDYLATIDPPPYNYKPNIEKIFSDAIKFEKAIHKGEVSGVEEDTSDEQVSPQKGSGDASKSGDSESDLPF